MDNDRGTIVVVEDDDNIGDLVELYLRRGGFRVLRAGEADSAWSLITSRQPRMAILDVGLPGATDGLELCRKIRARGDLPVLMLTARDGEVDRVLGLELGADDYVTKPFSPRELVARVKGILRRVDGPSGTRPPVVVVGAIEIDSGRREARVADQVVPLAAREFDLLAYMADNVGLVLTRSQLLSGVWGPGWYGDERTVDVHVRQLRKKLGDALPLATVWGVGYRLG